MSNKVNPVFRALAFGCPFGLFVLLNSGPQMHIYQHTRLLQAFKHREWTTVSK